MHHVVFVALLAALSLDFTTTDVPRLLVGARAVQWDDEEDSAPSRRERLDAAAHRTAARPDAPPSLHGPRPAMDAARRPTDRSSARLAWLVPVRSSPAPPPRSASPAEDH